MAHLVNAATAKGKVPVDRVDRTADHDLIQSRFLDHFATRRIRGEFAGFHVPLRETPVAVAVADEEEARFGSVESYDHAAGRHLLALRIAAHATPAVSPSMCARPSMNWLTTGSVVRLISSTVPTWRTAPSYSIAMRVPTR